MRTTVTLDPDVAAGLKEVMRDRGVSFKEALNAAVRSGLRGGDSARVRTFRQKTYRMGFRPDLPLDRALALADALEDEELIRKLAIEHGAELCSADGDFARFPGLRWHNPLDAGATP